MVKLKSNAEHVYNSFNGVTIAIEIAGILKFFDIVRLVVLEHKLYWIDLAILGLLIVTGIGEELITKTLFVNKRIKPNLSKRQKWILWLIVLVYFVTLTLLLIWWLPIFQLAKIV
jgi:hypothetical protein